MKTVCTGFGLVTCYRPDARFVTPSYVVLISRLRPSVTNGIYNPKDAKKKNCPRTEMERIDENDAGNNGPPADSLRHKHEG